MNFRAWEAKIDRIKVKIMLPVAMAFTACLVVMMRLRACLWEARCGILSFIGLMPFSKVM